jgi:hypothetical protein
VGLGKREGIGPYPVLEDLEAFVKGERYELGYKFRNYGQLSLSIIKRLEECGTIDKAPQDLNKIRDFYKLPGLVGSMSRATGKFARWMIDSECPKVGVLDVRIERGRKKKVFFGSKGVLFWKAASESSNPTRSFEDLIILSVLARKIRNFGLILSALHTEGTIECYCGRTRSKEIRQLQRKKTQLSLKSVSTTIFDAYLVHCESPPVIPFAMSSNNPLAISSLIYNEIYRVYHSLRIPLQIWINESAKMSKGLVTVNPFEVSDRMPREITRALEKLGLLHFLYGARYVSIPDRLLADLARYFGEITSKEASVEGRKPPNQVPLSSFVKLIQEEFRILLNPDDVIRFLEGSVNYRDFGIDLNTAKGYLISNYHYFTERLENLGLATIRPDGDVMIRIG